MKNIKKCINDMNKPLLIITILLCLFGLFNIVTVSSREAVDNLDQSIYYYFYKQLVILVLSFIGYIMVLSVDTKKYHALAPILYVGIFICNLYLVLKGVATRGANNWIDLGFFNFQPSEAAKPIVIVTLAILIERFSRKLRDPKENHVTFIAIITACGLFIPALVFAQKDLGTALILLIIFAVTYLLSPILKKEKLKFLGILGVFAVMLGMLYYTINGSLLTKAQLSRFDFFDPCDSNKYVGNGYQVCNAFISINLGGLTGVGIGNSTQKYSYIPEPQTDMVFAITAEEYGYLVCVGIIILYSIIIYHIMNLASKASTIRGKYICLGIGTYMFAHILINLGGLFGLIPLTGVPLPFLSYGGSFTISFIMSLGIVERIYIETKRDKLKF